MLTNEGYQTANCSSSVSSLDPAGAQANGVNLQQEQMRVVYISTRRSKNAIQKFTGEFLERIELDLNIRSEEIFVTGKTAILFLLHALVQDLSRCTDHLKSLA